MKHRNREVVVIATVTVIEATGVTAKIADRNEARPRCVQEPRVREEGSDDVAMVTYRMEVGNNDGITPSNIVGAIANEAGLDARNIGSYHIT